MNASDALRPIDLNADLGEGFGPYRIGNDAGMLEIVSSANIACGFHAGDPEIMADSFAACKSRGVIAGAHPGFPDRYGFGRRAMAFTPGEIERQVAYQIGAAQALSAYAGHPIRYVKAHGQLGHLTYQNPEVARAFARAIHAVDRTLICMTFPNGPLPTLARDLGLRVVGEIYADRGYNEDGFLLPRNQPGALLHDAQAAAERVLRMVRLGAIETATGRLLPMDFETVCLHGDNPDAMTMATAVRQALENAGVDIAPFA